MKKKIKILIVEDNLLDAELSEYVLKKAGIDFLSERVETEEDFKEMLNEFVPDVILSDYDMPFLDGDSALNIAKSIAPETPFIFLTGVPEDMQAREIKEKGEADFVLKDNLSRLAPVLLEALDLTI